MADTDETATSGSNSPSRARTTSAGAEVGNTVRRVRAAVENEAESLEDQVAQLQTDLKSITSTLNRLGHTAGNELKSGATAQAEELKAKGQSALHQAQDEFSALEKQIKDTIREKPLTAVAGAVALGFLLAVITR